MSRQAIAGLTLASCGLLHAVIGSPAAALRVCPQSVTRISDGSAGHTVEIPVLVTGTAELKAFGLDLVVTGMGTDVTVTRTRPGNVTRSWLVFDALTIGQQIRIGGYDSAGFSLSGTDTLVVLEFETLRPVLQVHLSPTNLVDDLAGAFVCWGQIGFTPPRAPPNGYISVLPQGVATCCYATPDGTQLQVVAHPAGNVAFGIFTAAFRVEISPPATGATLTWTPAPSVTESLGNPIDNTSAAGDTSGVLLVFPTCQAAIQGEVPLGTITVDGLSVSGHIFVKRHNNPSAAYQPCASFIGCDGTYLACMTSLEEDDPYIFRAQINQTSCDGDCGYVAIRSETWGRVRALYR